MVGREVVTGLAAFMADQPMGWDAIAHVGGVAWSLPAAVLREQALLSVELQSVLLQATHQSQIEAHSRAICAAFHLIMPRLALWLLTLQEQTGASDFPITQEALAQLLGVQPTTIVGAFAELTGSGALASGKRGRVVIQDRDALKAAACSCRSQRPSAGTARALAA